MELAISSFICVFAAISFIRRHRRSKKFTLNSVYTALVYNGMWAVAAIAHVLSYSQVDMSSQETLNLTRVICTQAASLIAAASDFVTVLVRLSYKPILTEICLRPASARRLLANYIA